MTDIFNLVIQALTHILIIFSMLAKLYLMAVMIFSSDDIAEKAVRLSAFATGILIYYGSKTIGVSIPSLMIQSLAITKPFSIGLFGILFPSLTGFFVAWYCVRILKRTKILRRG